MWAPPQGAMGRILVQWRASGNCDWWWEAASFTIASWRDRIIWRHCGSLELHRAELREGLKRKTLPYWGLMDLGLTGRVAIVAAASKGLGRAVAEELGREGAEIAI